MKRFSTFCFCLLCALCVTVMLSEAATTFRNHINAPKGSTTLAAGITAGETTVVVATGGGALLPAAPFSITVDNEIMAVSQKVNDTLTVSRGFDNSTASAHNIGANVYNYVIADDFVDIHTAINGIESGSTTLSSLTTSGNITSTSGSVTAGVNVAATGTVTGGTGMTATTGNITATVGDIIAGDDMQCDNLTANSVSAPEGETSVEFIDAIDVDSIVTSEGQVSINNNLYMDVNVDASRVVWDRNTAEGEDTYLLGEGSAVGGSPNALRTNATSLSIGYNKNSDTTSGIVITNSGAQDAVIGSINDSDINEGRLLLSNISGGFTSMWEISSWLGEIALEPKTSGKNIYIRPKDGTTGDTDLHIQGTVNPTKGIELGTYGDGEQPVTLAMDATEGEPVGRAELKATSVLITTPDAEGECDVVIDGDLDADVVTANECAPDVLTLGQTSLQQLPEGALDDYILVNANGIASTEGEFTVGNPAGALTLVGIGGVGVVSDSPVAVVPLSEGEVPFAVTGKATAISAEWGVEGDTTEFTASGFQKMSGAAQAWEDLRIEPVARATGTNVPAFEKYYDDSGNTSRGVYLYSFDDAITASEKELHFTMQLPHSWNQDDIYIHVHWVPSTADTTATPRWGLEYAWAEPGSNFSDSTIIYATGNHLSEADLTANRHYLTAFAAISPTTSQDGLSSVLIGRLFRNSGDVADTYDVGGNKCGLLYIDAHFQLNSLGSSSETGGKGE